MPIAAATKAAAQPHRRWAGAGMVMAQNMMAATITAAAAVNPAPEVTCRQWSHR
jgi:hypothetical protein